jgi:hypothetical protein
MALLVTYRSKGVSAEDRSETLKIAESVLTVSVRENTAYVSVYRRILEL